MALDNPLPNPPTTPIYCSPNDVAGELLKPANYFDTATTPSLARVQKFILQAEEHIDNQTGRSWRPRKRVNEYIDLGMNATHHSRAGIKFRLKRRYLKELSSAQGDKLEIWNGTDYEDWLVTKTEGRDKDFWLDYENGILYLRRFHPRGLEKIGRLTYRYGEEAVPLDISDATAKLVAMRIVNHEDNSFILEDAGNQNGMMYDPRISNMRRDVKEIIGRHADFGFFL